MDGANIWQQENSRRAVLKSNVTQNNESTSIWARAGCPLNHEVIQHVCYSRLIHNPQNIKECKKNYMQENLSLTCGKEELYICGILRLFR